MIDDVPHDIDENLDTREALIEAAQGNLAIQHELLRLCAADIFFWIDLFVFQVNPRHVGGESGPFICHDFQRDLIRDTQHRLLVERRSAVWEKSRYVGATWLALLMQIHECLFFKYRKFLDISHTEKAVDAGPEDADSLFTKITFVLDRLPNWMKQGARRVRAGVIHFPGMKSGITGAATTERAGVGGRATWVLCDEFAKQKNDYEILGQTADTGPRLFISTHYGIGGAFYDLTKPEAFAWKRIIHWSQHPELNKGLYRCDSTTGAMEVLDKEYKFPADYKFIKDGTPMGGPFPGVRSPWYDAECIDRNNPRDVAMHLDIDAKGSVTQYFHAPTIAVLRKRCYPALWEGDLVFNPDSGEPQCLIAREGGPLRLWIFPTPEMQVPRGKYVIGCDPSHGRGATPTCMSIGNCKTGEKVGEYVNAHLEIYPFAPMAVALCRLFSDGERGAKFIWERQGPGELLSKRVLELGYRLIYYDAPDIAIEKDESYKPGWFPSGDRKKLLFDAYAAALSTGECTNPSDRSLEQTLDFRYDRKGNPEHPGEKNAEDTGEGGVNHGDIVMADALMWKLLAEKLPGRGVKQKPQEIPVGSLAWRRQMFDKSERISRVWR